jgi:hypothetical protein
MNVGLPKVSQHLMDINRWKSSIHIQKWLNYVSAQPWVVEARFPPAERRQLMASKKMEIILIIDEAQYAQYLMKSHYNTHPSSLKRAIASSSSSKYCRKPRTENSHRR